VSHPQTQSKTLAPSSEASENPTSKAKSGDVVTPMMAQYLAIKKDHPGSLLFYRMGDFYELFFDDAIEASRALDIALTKRGKFKGQDIPMCGVPAHSHENYLHRLIHKGFKVSVCEQTENPKEAKKRGAKSVVNRAVKRVITRGTLTEDSLLDAREHNYLCAVADVRGELALAWFEISTGEFSTQAIMPGHLEAVLSRIRPSEILMSETMVSADDFQEALRPWQDQINPIDNKSFDSERARLKLQKLFEVKTLQAFGDFGRSEVAAAGALIDYVEQTQKGQLPRLNGVRQIRSGGLMEMDAATRRNLELTMTLSGNVKGSLLDIIDFTKTGSGARLLATRLASPLTDVDDINGRLDDVQFLLDRTDLRTNLRDHFEKCPDMERALSRVSLDRGGPRDLAVLLTGLSIGHSVRRLLEDTEADGGMDKDSNQVLTSLSGGLAEYSVDLGHHHELIDLLRRALKSELPTHARDGGFIQHGFSPSLDELLELRDESRRLIAELQGKYIGDTGLSILKIRQNNVLGFFIEVPARQAENMPTGTDSIYIHRQTLANQVRYTTVELSDIEGRIARAADQALALELQLFDELVTAVKNEASQVAAAAAAIAGLDVAASLAELAVTRRYCRPKINNSYAFDIKNGRHAVVEAVLQNASSENAGRAFIANDCCLGAKVNRDDESDKPDKLTSSSIAPGRLWLLSGPNMAGKSTFLRQNALIAVLAQMGSFVPATSAQIGIIDRLFSRVGAADDLARGQSTFMVEMVETATILNQAGPKSLVILDEIGRGTATYDGLSIAWAVIEHLHQENRSRALFATHYHELTSLASRLDELRCHTMRVKEWQDEVVFLHEVAEGTADRSYGIHVGKLAGLPEGVIDRAGQVLSKLEEGDQASAITRLADDLPLFQALQRPQSVIKTEPQPWDTLIDEIQPDHLSPIQALEWVYQLKAMKNDGPKQ